MTSIDLDEEERNENYDSDNEDNLSKRALQTVQNFIHFLESQATGRGRGNLGKIFVVESSVLCVRRICVLFVCEGDGEKWGRGEVREEGDASKGLSGQSIFTFLDHRLEQGSSPTEQKGSEQPPEKLQKRPLFRPRCFRCEMLCFITLVLRTDGDRLQNQLVGFRPKFSKSFLISCADRHHGRYTVVVVYSAISVRSLALHGSTKGLFSDLFIKYDVLFNRLPRPTGFEAQERYNHD